MSVGILWRSVPDLCHFCSVFRRHYYRPEVFTFNCPPERLMQVQFTGRRCKLTWSDEKYPIQIKVKEE